MASVIGEIYYNHGKHGKAKSLKRVVSSFFRGFRVIRG
jgi:hypothetical protein